MMLEWAKEMEKDDNFWELNLCNW